MKAGLTVRKSSKTISKGIVKICSIYVEWRLNAKGLDLSTMDMEYITNALIQNDVEGELYTIGSNGKVIGGSWNIQWN